MQCKGSLEPDDRTKYNKVFDWPIFGMLGRLGRHFCSSGTLSLCVVSMAHAATIVVAPQASIYATPDLSAATSTIRLTGPIAPGDADRLRVLLQGSMPRGIAPGKTLMVAELSSTAGDYYEAMKIGYLLRDFHVATVVRKGDQCLSACVLAFLGGSARDRSTEGPTPRRYIEIGGTVGYRNYYSKPVTSEPAPNYPIESIVDYSINMGVQRRFIAMMLGRAPEQFIYFDSVETFLTARTCPIGLGRPATSLAMQAINACSYALRWRNPDSPLKSTAMAEPDARRYLLKYVKLHIWWLGVIGEPAHNGAPGVTGEKSDLARRLNSDEYLRSEAATRKLYDDLKAAGLPLPELAGSIFEVTGYNTGFDASSNSGLYARTGCIVSLSTSSPSRPRRAQARCRFSTRPPRVAMACPVAPAAK